MGQKTYKDSPHIDVTGYGSSVSFFRESAGADHPSLENSGGWSPYCTVSEPVCEFRDYCNHLYYSDGKCDCPRDWEKRAGLVLPVSA